MWNDRGNMLGTGGRLYLDGDLGEGGCKFGVHTDTGWWVTLMETGSGEGTPALAPLPYTSSGG